MAGERFQGAPVPVEEGNESSESEREALLREWAGLRTRERQLEDAVNFGKAGIAEGFNQIASQREQLFGKLQDFGFATPDQINRELDAKVETEVEAARKRLGLKE